MFDSLKNIVHAVKEGAVEAAAKVYVNQKIQNFGTVTNLQIDSRAKTILLETSLKGEAAPVFVKVLNYEVVSAADSTYLVCGRFEASREWITAVLNEYVAGERIPVPANVQRLL
jgi:hypothetical protein